MHSRLIALVLPILLAGCATSPPATTTIRHAGFEWTLPPEFTDDTAYFVQNYGLDREVIELNKSHGQFVEPLMKFESAPRHRFDGGCVLVQVRLTPKHGHRSLSLRQLIREKGQAIRDPKLDAIPNRPLSLLRPIQGMLLENSLPIKLAGMSGWQETWRIHWAAQNGPAQLTSLVTLKMADISNPATLASDRVSLQMVCMSAGLDTYIETASHNVLAVADTLKPAP